MCSVTSTRVVTAPAGVEPGRGARGSELMRNQRTRGRGKPVIASPSVAVPGCLVAPSPGLTAGGLGLAQLAEVLKDPDDSVGLAGLSDIDRSGPADQRDTATIRAVDDDVVAHAHSTAAKDLADRQFVGRIRRPVRAM